MFNYFSNKRPIINIKVLIVLLTLFVVNIHKVEAVTFDQWYQYTGGQQTLTVPYTGTYRLAVWGASGGNYNSSYLGGWGGYSIGNVNLVKGEVLYIHVGGYGLGNGSHSNWAGGYNGGGAVSNITSDGNQRTASGGGATHIATAPGLLSQLSGNRGSVLIVAGGGGGGGGNSAIMGTSGGQGGGYIGGQSSSYVESTIGLTAYATGGTQTGPGAGNWGGGGFGYGAASRNSGSGGGWFGGGISQYTAGGGSGYIGNSRLISSDGVTKHMAGYNVATTTDPNAYTISTTCTSGNATWDCAKQGHGAALISLLRTGPYLNGLTVKQGSLKEAFAYNKYNYTWVIPKGVDELTNADVTAPPMYQGTTVVIPQSVPFTQDGDTFVIQTIDDSAQKLTYTLTMQRFVSSDARLATLESDKGIFNKTFNKDDANYVLEIFEDAESVTLSGEVFEQDAEVIDGLGEIELTKFETPHTITVQAEDGTIKIYNVTIRKNMYLKNIIFEGLDDIDCEGDQCVLSPEFDPAKTNYTIKVPTDYYKLDVTYVPSDENLTVGVRVNDVTYVKDYVMQRTKNVIVFNIYNESNAAVKTYTVTLIRENSIDGKIKNLKVNKGRLVEDFNKSKYGYTWIIPKGVDVLNANDVSVTLFNSSAVANIPNNVHYTKDGDTFTINVSVKDAVDFNYTGGQQSFVVPYTGLYKLQTWGASGGNYNSSYLGGWGGYSEGYADLTAGETLYINVGGYGYGNTRHESLPGGYNGGGSVTINNSDGNQRTASGGGATHIATAPGLLYQLNGNRNSVLIVAGGGGGAGGNVVLVGYHNQGATTGGQGGGFIGGTSSTYSERPLNVNLVASAPGGNQTGPGSSNHGSGGFGYGASSNQSGAGGGWFGGGASTYTGGGGSGYIGNSRLVSSDTNLKHMVGYRVATTNDANTRTYATTCVSGGPVADCAKSGHGYAKITLLDADSISKTYTLTLQREVSSDARLATLTANTGRFTEEFDKDKHDYVLEMYHKQTKVTFDATPFEQDAIVLDGLDEVDLPNDEETHEITVQAEDGTIGIYTITIRRNMYIEDLGLEGLEDLNCKSYECNMVPSFSPEIIYYEYRVPLDYNILDVYYEPASADHRTEMTINGEPYVDGYVLPYSGVTTVKIHVYNDNDEIVKTYTMNVIKKYEYVEDFEYTGSYEVFIAPRTGKYYMQTWGASGGDAIDLAGDGFNVSSLGGNGGYSSGYINLDKGERLYVYVGGQGTNRYQDVGVAAGGYNGGGDGQLRTIASYRQASGGGGATDIRLVSGAWDSTSSLASRIMVAGGGGGISQVDHATDNRYIIDGGPGGGLNGLPGTVRITGGASNITPTGGTQTYGGQSSGGTDYADWRSTNYTSAYIGSFGKGATILNPTNDIISSGGGGGGYWGGATGVWKSGGGGSSFISGHTGSVAVTAEDDLVPRDGCANGTEDIECSYHYSDKIFTDTVMKAGNEEMPTYDGLNSMVGNDGNGYAKIRLEETETMLASLEVNSVELAESFDKTRLEYTWIIPKGVDEFTSDDIDAILLYPDKAHIEWPSDPVHFNKDGDKFTFKVVADNGEEDTYTLTMIRYKSDDARLATLESDKGILSPEFDPDINSYSLQLHNIDGTINLDATPFEQDAIIVSGLGEVELEDEAFEHQIVVTAEDGTVNTYNILIKKDAYLLYLGLNKLDTVPCVGDECILDPLFESESNEYSIKVPYEYETLDVYYLTAASDQHVKIKVDDQEVNNYRLPVGDTIVNVELYDKNNILLNTYTMTITREKGNYATLNSLEVSVGEFDIPFDKETEEYTWIIPSDVSTNLQSYITYVKTDPGATVELIPSSINYTQDGDTFDIVVTAEDGVTIKTYTITLQQDIIEDIEVDENMLLVVSEVKNLYINGLPDGCVGKYLYDVDDPLIAVVYDNGDVAGIFPGETDITISVKNHPEIESKTVHVTVISNELESIEYYVREKEGKPKIIIGADPETTILEFKNNLINPNEYIMIYDEDNNLLSDDDIVKTGLIIKLVIDDTEYDEAIMVIRGDVDKDGYVNISDYILVSNHALESEYIDDYVQFAAADVEEDEVLNIADYIGIMDYGLENSNSLNE